jgi:hypothetical protein
LPYGVPSELLNRQDNSGQLIVRRTIKWSYGIPSAFHETQDNLAHLIVRRVIIKI